MSFLSRKKGSVGRRTWLSIAGDFCVSVLLFLVIFSSIPLPVFALMISGGDDTSGEVVLDVPVVSASAGEESVDVPSVTVDSPALANTPAEELVSTPIVTADEGEVISAVSVVANEGESVAVSPDISAGTGEETAVANTSTEEVMSVANAPAEELVFVPEVVGTPDEEGSPVVVAGNAGEAIILDTTNDAVSPVANTPAEVLVVSPAVSADSGESTDPVAVSGNAGEETFSIATFGDEGVAIALPTSPLVVQASSGEGDTYTPAVLSSAGEEDSVILAQGSAGEATDTTLAVFASAGEESFSNTVVVSGSAGEGDSNAGFVFVSGNAGEGSSVTPVVVGDDGETNDTDIVPEVIGSAGEGGLVVANPPSVIGNPGETPDTTPVPPVTGNPGETPDTTPVPPVTGNSGEVDMCSNMAETQLTVPVGYIANGDGTCTQESTNNAGNGGTGVTDVCSNIAGNQATVPNGYTANGDGTCSEVVVVPVDVCSNIAGAQATVPAGYTGNADGTCTQQNNGSGGGVTDVCSNIAGNQATVPNGYTANGDGTCTEVVVAPVDVCSNIAGTQATLPSGYTQNADGTCTQQSTGNGGGNTGNGNTGGNVNTGGGSIVVQGGGGGGSGYGSASFGIYNEAVIEISPGVVAVQWTTNQPGISRVVFGTSSVTTLVTTSPFWGYERGLTVNTSPTTNHVAVIEGLETGVPYFFRALSTRNGYKEITGKELSFVVTGTATITEAKDQCPFLSAYLQKGAINDIEQVVRLQAFLQLHEEFSVDITGTYDARTESAVHAFQNKYADEILLPWGKDVSSTGYVYITTKWKINQIVCGSAELTLEEQSIIESYQNRTEFIGVGGTNVTPARGQESELIVVPEDTDDITPTPMIIGVEENNSDQLASALRANDTQCIFDTERPFIVDTFLFLPRLVYCVLHPIVGSE